MGNFKETHIPSVRIIRAKALCAITALDVLLRVGLRYVPALLAASLSEFLLSSPAAATGDFGEALLEAALSAGDVLRDSRSRGEDLLNALLSAGDIFRG